MEGSASNVTVNGQQDQDLTEQVRIHLWEAFCSTGFSDYTHLVALGG